MKNLFESLLTPEEFDASAGTLYGLPKEKKFPLHDKAHVIKAIQFFELCPTEKYAILANNIRERMRELDICVEIDPDMLAYQYLGGADLKNKVLELPYEMREEIIRPFTIPIPPKDTPEWWSGFVKKMNEEMESAKEVNDVLITIMTYMETIYVYTIYQAYNGNMPKDTDLIGLSYAFIADIYRETLCRNIIEHDGSMLLDRLNQELSYYDPFIIHLMIRGIEVLKIRNLEIDRLLLSLRAVFEADKQPERPHYLYINKERFRPFILSLDDYFKNIGYTIHLPMFEALLKRLQKIQSSPQPYIIPSSTVKYTDEGSVEFAPIIIDERKKQFLKEFMTDSKAPSFLHENGIDLTIDDIQASALLEEKMPITLLRLQDIQPNIDRGDSRYFCFLESTEGSIALACSNDDRSIGKMIIGSVDGGDFVFKKNEQLLTFIDSEEFDPSITTEGISVNPDGSLRFTLKPQKSYMDEYAEAHRILVENHKSRNYEAMKGNLCFLFTLIATIERDVLYTKKPVSNDVKKDAMDARAAAINDFKTYLKVVQENDKEFDFMKYYQDSNYGKLVVTITPASIRGMKKLLTAILY